VTETTTTSTTTTATTTQCPSTTTQTTTGTGSTSTTGTTTTTATTPAGCPPPGTPPGGGQVGALVISRYVKAGSEDGADTFNHFSLLKTIEGLFSVPQLGYAKDASLPEFDTAVFNNYTAG
jgi:hypothetical protein